MNFKKGETCFFILVGLPSYVVYVITYPFKWLYAQYKNFRYGGK